MLVKKIEKKGNSNYVLLSKDFLDSLGLTTGDKVTTKLIGKKIVIMPIKQAKE